MDKQEERAYARMREADRLYRSGLTLREVGEQLDPPVSTQRVGQMLDRGVALGIFGDPRRDFRSRYAIDAEAVRQAALEVGKREQIAVKFHVSRKTLEEAFGKEIDAVFAERRKARKAARAERTRNITVEEYLRVAQSLGRNPTSSDLGNGALCRRIYTHFGTFQAFLDVVGVRADYTKQTWRDRHSGYARSRS